MIKIGSMDGSPRKEQIPFKEFKKLVQKGAVSLDTKRFLIKTIFPPAKFPSASIIFDTPNYEVKLTVRAEVFSAIAKEVGLKKFKDLTGKKLFIVVGDDMGMYVDVEEGEGVYAWNDKGYYRLTSEDNSQKDDEADFDW